MFNNTPGPRPVSWALSDDILDRNIDQLDRETPRCNLSEEEEEELERSKLAIESQNTTQAHQVPNSCISKSWMPVGRGKDTSVNQPVPAPGFQSQPLNGPGSPFMKSGNVDIKNQTSQEPSFQSSTVVMTTSSSQPKLMGYASPTMIPKSASTSVTSHSNQHTVHSHSSAQQPGGACLTRAFPKASVTPPSNANGLAQGKPLGMVTPQMPNQIQPPKATVPPQSPPISSSKFPGSNGYLISSKEVSPTSLKNFRTQSTKSSSSQTAAVAPQQKQHQQPPFKQQQKQQQPPFHQQQQQQPAFLKQQQQNQQSPLSKQQQPPFHQQPKPPLHNKQQLTTCQPKQQQQKSAFKQVHGFQGDPNLHLAYCQVPDCKACREAKKWNDDPTKKALLIRQVEDEILLRSRELDSCWQEDELDCVRDFTDMDRRKEMTYAYTSEEGIYKRVSDEIIKRPPIWHDDEVDSVKDFSDRKGQESEVSKVGSEEKVCLSPPWNEEEEDILAREGVVMVHGISTISSSAPTSSKPTTTSVTSEKIEATVSMSNYKMIHEEADSVRDYTSYSDGQELGSRIPSSERINFTPPWTPSGCQTPAEGVPLPLGSKDTQTATQAKPPQSAVVATSIETSISQKIPATTSIDTSSVVLRDKSKRGRASANKEPYVVPRFDDLEEDSVTDFSAPERKLQGLSSKIPSYEYIPFTPPWFSNDNSGIQTPREYTSELNVTTVTPITTSVPPLLSPSSTSQAPSVLPHQLPATNPQALPPVLDSFRAGGHYATIYGDHSTPVDSIKNYSAALIEETSRIPSSEQLCFTPPWIENEEEHIENGNNIAEVSGNTAAQELTLEEQRAIEEEARKTGIQEAEAKAKEQRKNQPEAAVGNGGKDGAAAGPPGRDSGFCSEQDQKQKQQEQQNHEQTDVPDNCLVKPNPQFEEEPPQVIISEDKTGSNESPNRCWSSKDSSGSNQTDISTVVNPATSVPITAPGSPDPDGSEASDGEVSENEGHDAGQVQRSAAPEICPKSAAIVTQPDALQPQANSTSQKNQYIHHSQSFSYPHDNSQQANPLPSHQSYPRIQQPNMHYQTGPFDPAEQHNLKGGHAIGHPRLPAPYHSRPQGYTGEQARSHIQVQPYKGHYDSKGQLLGSMSSQVPAQVHASYPNAANMHYASQQGIPQQGIRCQGIPQQALQQHGMPHHHGIPQQALTHQQLSHRPILHHQVPHQMHQIPRQVHQHNDAQMVYYRGQRPPFHPNQGPHHPSFDGNSPTSNVKSGHLMPGSMPLAHRPQGHVSSSHVTQVQIPAGLMQPGMHMHQGPSAKGQMSPEQMQLGQKSISHVNRQHYQKPLQQQQLEKFDMHGMMEERYSRVMQQGLQNMINMESGMVEEKTRSSNQMQPSSASQLNLETAADQHRISDSASVVSFSSVAASHQNLDTKVDMVSSLLSMLGTHDKDDVARTLLAMSSSTDSCSAMRQSGCLPLLIKLLHDPEYEVKGINWEARHRAGLALHNIINSGTVDRKGRREVRVLRLIEIVRSHSEAVLSGKMDKYQAHKRAPALRDHGPGPAVAALMKLSFEEEHKNTITELGGLQVIAELLKVDSTLNGQCKDPYSITLRKYAGMALINLTYSDGRNKNVLLEMRESLKAIIGGLTSAEEEDLVQVSAGILRNVSWKSDENGKRTLAELNTAQSLMSAVQHIRSEAAIRSVLSAVWNLSAHSPGNKEEICSTPGSLKFLCFALNYRSPSRSLAVPENAGGIMRNISSHIAVKPEYRQILREHGCLKVLISHLRSPSTRVVSNSCGILWNLSARCIEDQELLWELGAVSMLKTLVHSKHKSISTSSASALRNLMAVKPGSSSTDNESHASFSFRRSNTLPGKGRAQSSQNGNVRSDRKYRSFFSRKQPAKEVPNTSTTANESTLLLKKVTNKTFQNSAEDSRKVHRKVKHGEPHYYADLYQDPPRRGITMPQTKDPTIVLYSSENVQGALEGPQEELPLPFSGSRVERWNKLQNGNQCSCKHGALPITEQLNIDSVQQGMRGMAIEEESPFIARQRPGSSSSSLSSCSPPAQTTYNPPMPRINTENSPLSIFRERRPNPGLCLHRRSMSDTISEFGHLSQDQKPLHAVTDSELAKPDGDSVGFRKDECKLWPSNVHRHQLVSKNYDGLEFRDAGSRTQHRNLRLMNRYEEVAHYETHFLSPYDDCPLSFVRDSVSFPHFSLGYRPKQDFSPVRPDMIPQESNTPKVFVQETHYDIRQAYQRRSNETIASSVQSSREDLTRRCRHNHSGTSVWQCDCNETENVWIRKMREAKKSEAQRLDQSDNSKVIKVEGSARQEGQRPPNWQGNERTVRGDIQCHAAQASQHHTVPQPNCCQNTQFVQLHKGSKGSLRYNEEYRGSAEKLNYRDSDWRAMTYYSDDNQKHQLPEKIHSNQQPQYPAAPIKDAHKQTGMEMNVLDLKPREHFTAESCAAVAKDSAAVDSMPCSDDGRKPLRSSLKSPSDGLKHKFRKKHITQKVVAASDKKKSKAKDNVMVTSL